MWSALHLEPAVLDGSLETAGAAGHRLLRHPAGRLVTSILPQCLTLTAREIIRLGWRAGEHEAEQLRIYVRRLRLKLEPLDLACRLVSQHNRGYCLIVD
jgi:hypothetical protein